MYGRNIPLSESTNPMQVKGNPNLSINISTPLISNWIYNRNNTIKIIIANTEANIPRAEPFARASIISCCPEIFRATNTSFANSFETDISHSYKIGNDTAKIIALAKYVTKVIEGVSISPSDQSIYVSNPFFRNLSIINEIENDSIIVFNAVKSNICEPKISVSPFSALKHKSIKLLNTEFIILSAPPNNRGY